MTSTRDRARGVLVGLATGDALGTTVEFNGEELDVEYRIVTPAGEVRWMQR